MNTPIDLRTCKPGQKLRSKHGLILTYVGMNTPHTAQSFPHEIAYPEGGGGSRTHDGFVMANPASRLESDHDIIEILPLEE